VPFSLLLLVYLSITSIHILWINLVTDGLPGLALASEPAEGNNEAAARDPQQNIFAGKMA
jgi:Ca2+-transporting ATPase